MSAQQGKHEGPLPEAEGYERIDASAGSTIWAGIYVLGTMFLVAAVVVPLYWFYARREAKEQPRAATVLKAVPSPGVFPRLVTNEPRTLAEFRAREDALLDTYGWIEKDRGIARMPIAEAIQIVAERGSLPPFLAPMAAGTKAAPAASTKDEVPAPVAGGPTTPGGTR
jgi:hypothetical protein